MEDAQTSLNIHICTGQVHTLQNMSFALKASSNALMFPVAINPLW